MNNSIIQEGSGRLGDSQAEYGTPHQEHERVGPQAAAVADPAGGAVYSPTADAGDQVMRMMLTVMLAWSVVIVTKCMWIWSAVLLCLY